MARAGVRWATSWVLLHFGYRDRYPILDYRALSAWVSQITPNTVSFWNAYAAACRTIDDETGLGMRTIDRALWQWPKEQDKN